MTPGLAAFFSKPPARFGSRCRASAHRLHSGAQAPYGLKATQPEGADVESVSDPRPVSTGFCVCRNQCRLLHH